MNISDLMSGDALKAYAEKFGLETNQFTELISNALPMLKEGGDINAIAEKVSATTGISLDSVKPFLEQMGPKIQEFLNGQGGGIGELLGNFLGEGKLDGNGIGDLLGGFFGKK